MSHFRERFSFSLNVPFRSKMSHFRGDTELRHFVTQPRSLLLSSVACTRKRLAIEPDFLIQRNSLHADFLEATLDNPGHISSLLESARALCQNPADYLARDIGQSATNAVVIEGELFVIDAQ